MHSFVKKYFENQKNFLITFNAQCSSYVHEIRLNRMYVGTYVGMYVICMHILVL